MSGEITDEWNPALVNHRLRELETARRESSVAFTSLGEALTSIKVMQAESHADRLALSGTIDRAMTTMESIERRSTANTMDLEARIKAVEEGIPVFKLISKYVIIGVVGVIGLLGASLLNLVLSSVYRTTSLKNQSHIASQLGESNHDK